MGEYSNPFTPSFGEMPAKIAGRKTIISPLQKAFNNNFRAPELTMLITGARGTGKTTLLSFIAQEACKCGWICAEVTATNGMLNDIALRANKATKHLVNTSTKKQIKNIGVPDLINEEFQDNKSDNNWRMVMENLLESLEETDTGLLITVDEVDPNLDEVKQLAMTYQHFVWEGKKVSLIMAGLPHNVSSLINEKAITFLRSAQLSFLGPLADNEVKDALAKTINIGGRSIDLGDLQQAVSVICGFPYLLQLVGYRMWDVNPSVKKISHSDVELGISIALDQLEHQILQATYRDLSNVDVAFLKAMIQDESVSKTADIAKRLNISSSQAAQYRRRLIDAGIIGQRRRGEVAFELPFFRNYIKEHVD